MGAVTDETNNSEFRAELTRIWDESAAAMCERLDAIDAAGVALLAGSLDERQRAAALAAAHKLAGSLGTFDLPHGSELASELEALLRAPGVPPTMRLSELAELLRAIVDQGPPTDGRLAADAGGTRRVETQEPAAARREERGQTIVDVLMVDDDMVLTELVRHALETRGYRVTVLDDGRVAVEALIGPLALRCRLLLLDVDLPGLDGLSVLRRLAAAGLVPATPVIMLTVRGSEAEILEALRLGAVDHVTKPFSLAILMQRIRVALER
jgi:CheY-like chemotaxis protein/HPt (histidine-containing phosphotransfer) domain-containing protein